MDVTPLIPAGRQVVESYGDGRFRVTGTLWDGSVIVLPTRTLAWPVHSLAEVTVDSLQLVIGEADVLLIGCGARMALLPKPLRDVLRGQGIVVETMDTGAACRTYNVLLSEDRKVAAALLAV